MHFFRFGALLLLATCAAAQATGPAHQLHFVAEPQTFPLWEHGAPGALGTGEEDIPALTVYLPLDPLHSETAVVIAPGGSYHMLASNHEGRQLANWFNAMGVTAFVLKYRLGPRYHHPIELGDGQRAIRYVRSQAAKYGFRTDRIGLMGFSAGGHLASSVATHFDNGNPSASDPIDRVSCRPDFLILGYPVILMTPPYSHEGSVTNLLGENASMELRKEMSSELHVSAQTPPTFLFSTSADDAVPVENTIAFYSALHKEGVAAEMHIFEKGPHGVGMDLADPVLGIWPTLLTNWLRQRGLLAAAQ